uniref:WDGH domain-containing protein n=1 Tax=Klebsiella pneumoniae TaxID=573 RepID=UPI003F67827A
MTLKPITVTSFLQTLKADASTYETRAAVEQLIGEYLDTAKQLQDAGLFSDGYHTFEELYAHRVRLFTCLMHAHRNRAWWSEKHHDGSFMPGWIIAGIETPVGQATYHLPISESHFLPEGIKLERGKEWDGHTAADVLRRVLS